MNRLFQGKLSRLSFFLWSIFVYCIGVGIAVLLARFDLLTNWNVYWIVYIAYIPIIILASKRLNDMGLSPYLSLIMFVGPLGIIGSFIDGIFYLFLVIKK